MGACIGCQIDQRQCYNNITLKRNFLKNTLWRNFFYIRSSVKERLMETLARTPEHIGTALRRTRKVKGWTQKDVSERSGLRVATISSVENGDAGTQIKTILAIMMALDLEFRIGNRGTSQPDIEDIF